MAGLEPSLLLLHGTGDTTVPVQVARNYEAAAVAAGKRIEAQYYQGAQHTLPFLPNTSRDVRQRAIAFSDRQLKG